MVAEQHQGCCKVTQRGRQGPMLFSLSVLHSQLGDSSPRGHKTAAAAAPGVSSHNCDQKRKKVSLHLMAEENGFRPPGISTLLSP